MSEIVVQPFQSLDLIDTMSEYVGNNEDSEIIKAENVASLPSSTRGDEGIIEGVTIVDHSNMNDDQLQYSSESNDEGEEGIVIHAGRNSVRKPAYRKSLSSSSKYYQRPDGLQSSTSTSVELFNSSDNKTNQGEEDLKKLRFPRHVTAFDVDIHALDDHPWRNKSVDLSDYFNYGFNERSWLQYCDKQLRLRNQKGLGPYQPPDRTIGVSTSNMAVLLNTVSTTSTTPFSGVSVISASTLMDIVSNASATVDNEVIQKSEVETIPILLLDNTQNSSPNVSSNKVTVVSNMESSIISSVPSTIETPVTTRAPPPPLPAVTATSMSTNLSATPFPSLKPPPPPPPSTVPPLNTSNTTLQGNIPTMFSFPPPPPGAMPPSNFLKPSSVAAPMNMYGILPTAAVAAVSNPTPSLLKDMYGPSRSIDYSKVTHTTNIETLQQPPNLLRDMYGPSTISNIHSSSNNEELITNDKKYYSNKRNRDTTIETDNYDTHRRGYKDVDYDMESDIRDKRRKTESSRSHRDDNDRTTVRSRDRGARGNRETSDRGNSRDRGMKDRGNVRDRGNSRDRGSSRDRESSSRRGDTSERSRKR